MGNSLRKKIVYGPFCWVVVLSTYFDDFYFLLHHVGYVLVYVPQQSIPIFYNHRGVLETLQRIHEKKKQIVTFQGRVLLTSLTLVFLVTNSPKCHSSPPSFWAQFRTLKTREASHGCAAAAIIISREKKKYKK